MTTTTFKFAGSISHGTMLDKDLLERFAEVLALLKPEAALPLCERVDDALGTDAYDEVVAETVEDLFAELDACAPDGYYFGSHPGDGSDFGFWVNEEAAQPQEEDVWTMEEILRREG